MGVPVIDESASGVRVGQRGDTSPAHEVTTRLRQGPGGRYTRHVARHRVGPPRVTGVGLGGRGVRAQGALWTNGREVERRGQDAPRPRCRRRRGCRPPPPPDEPPSPSPPPVTAPSTPGHRPSGV